MRGIHPCSKIHSNSLSVHLVFHSVGLFPSSETKPEEDIDIRPTGMFAYQGPTTPGTVRKGLLLTNSVLAEADETCERIAPAAD
jgi:hypothetical protein